MAGADRMTIEEVVIRPCEAGWPPDCRLRAALGAPGVGNSGSAIIALDLALRRPDLVRHSSFSTRRSTSGAASHRGSSERWLGRSCCGGCAERRGAEHWMRYVASYSTGGSAFETAPAERRERLLENSAAIFDDVASGAGEHVDETRLADISVPVTIIEARLSPPFLRRSCKRLKRLMPQARTVTLANSDHHVGMDAADELLGILREATTATAASPK